MTSSKGKPTDPELREQLKEGMSSPSLIFVYHSCVRFLTEAASRDQAGAEQERRWGGPVVGVEGVEARQGV